MEVEALMDIKNSPLTRLFAVLRVDLSHKGRGKIPVLAACTSPLVGEVACEQREQAGEGSTYEPPFDHQTPTDNTALLPSQKARILDTIFL